MDLKPDQDLPKCATPKNLSESPLALECALKLLGLEECPGGDRMIPFFLDSTEKLIARNGVAWVMQHRKRLALELQIVAEM